MMNSVSPVLSINQHRGGEIRCSKNNFQNPVVGAAFRFAFAIQPQSRNTLTRWHIIVFSVHYSNYY